VELSFTPVAVNSMSFNIDKKDLWSQLKTKANTRIVYSTRHLKVKQINPSHFKIYSCKYLFKLL